MERSKIIIVYHVFINHPENWRSIVMGQICDIIDSNLLSISYLYVSLTGKQSLIDAVKNVITLKLRSVTKNMEFILSNDNMYEYPSIEKLHSLSQIKSNQGKLFIYLHTKGMSQSHSPMDRTGYNIFLTRTLLWNYKNIIELFESNSKINKIGLFPARNGWIWFNFFWARFNYLQKCSKPLITNRRHSYEDWLGSNGHPFYDDCLSLYNNHHNVYFSAQDACKYLNQIVANMHTLIVRQPITLVTYGRDDHIIFITKDFVNLATHSPYLHINNQTLHGDPYHGYSKILTIILKNGEQFYFKEGSYILLQIC